MTEQRLGNVKGGVCCIYEVWDDVMTCWAKLSTAGEVMRYK